MEETDEKNEIEPILLRKTRDLSLSSRATNCLRRHDVNNVNELLHMSYNELALIRNMGPKTLNEIIDKVHSLGLKFDWEKEEQEKSLEERIEEAREKKKQLKANIRKEKDKISEAKRLYEAYKLKYHGKHHESENERG